MFGRKQKQNQPAPRRPAAADRNGSQVFSYHASRSAGGSGARSVGKTPWSGPANASVRPKPAQPWLRRTTAVVVGILLVAFAIFNTTLSRDPSVVALGGAERQILLRSTAVYEHAADDIFGSSIMHFSKLTINTDRVAADMQRQFPELSEVSVTLPLIGRRPVVYIQPAQPVALLRASDSGVYIIDSSGRAVMNASQVAKVEELGLGLIEDQSGLPVTLGQAVLPSDSIAFITEVTGQLRAKNLAITSMVLPKAAAELDIRVGGAPYIVKFNLRGDARVGVGAYLAVKQQLERQNKTPGSYIDVRVDNKAYYK